MSILKNSCWDASIDSSRTVDGATYAGAAVQVFDKNLAFVGVYSAPLPKAKTHTEAVHSAVLLAADRAKKTGAGSARVIVSLR